MAEVIAARRDVRRFRPDDLDESLIEQLLIAAHHAPSVGHSQPWRFIVVRDSQIRARAAWLADRERLRQAAQLDEQSGRQLLDLRLEGIRDAPVGIVVCCDRRVPAAGVLGRATFVDADTWSCACAIQNLWLTARALGLGVGWVTLFEPDDLKNLIGVPPGVETLGWLCVGRPDEREPAPGLERRAWSLRAPLASVVMRDRWSQTDAPRSRLRVDPPASSAVVAARDRADRLLTPPGSLGLLDLVVDRVVALTGPALDRATLVIVGGDHPVADLGVTPFDRRVTRDVLVAARAGRSIGVASALAADLVVEVLDAGSSTGDLARTDALSEPRVDELIDRGIEVGRRVGAWGLVACGEVGIGNTTVAAALASVLLARPADDLVGVGSGSDSSMVQTKREVIGTAVARWYRAHPGPLTTPSSVRLLLAALGGPEFAVLAGVVIGAASAGGAVVLDGLATGVAAALACALEPAVSAHLVAGQRSNEQAHHLVLNHLGLEPLLDLRLRCGEGVGAAMASRLILDAVATRRTTAITTPIGDHRSVPDGRSS